jgi:Raf kinase inhibitor-like YbhB/YbcL family protein
MILTSPSFDHNTSIPKKFTCEGGSINPELHIGNVPENVKSLALIMHDPDAPREGGFTHWVVWNIAPNTAIIKQESIPPGGVEGLNSAQQTGYRGPCPPSGTHHYEFTLYALDATLDLPVESGKTELEAAIDPHILAQTQLVGLYQKQA